MLSYNFKSRIHLSGAKSLNIHEMTTKTLHTDIILESLPALGHSVPINAQLIAQILNGDEVIVRSELAVSSEANRSWTFEIHSDM